jgi:hypothetical protein
MKTESKSAGCLFALLGIPLSIFLNAWVIKLLWGWFVPLGPITGLQAFGISLLAGLLAKSPVQKDDPKDGESYNMYVFRLVSVALLKPLFILGMGWAAHVLFQ